VKKQAFMLFLGGEFYGVFPSREDCVAARRRAVHQKSGLFAGPASFALELAEEAVGPAVVDPRRVTRNELSHLKDDDVSDAEWEEYS
jgi:hypothetical protein